MGFLAYMYEQSEPQAFVGDALSGPNVRDAYNEAKGELGDTYKKAFSKEEGGITASEFFGTIGSSIRNKVNDFTSKFTTDPRQDDKVYIPVEAKTLLGDDFTSLYTGTSTKTVETDAGKIDIIKPSNAYSTEMYFGGIASPNKVTYNGLSGKDKATYEIILMTKKYASEYNADANNAAAINEAYSADLEKYHQYCKENDINWNNVLHTVSSELQRETCEFRDKNDKNNLYVTNLSHNLLIAGAGPNYEDYPNSIVDYMGYSYEDTLDLNVDKHVSSWKGMTNSVKTKVLWLTSGVTGFVGKVVDGAQTQAANLANKIQSENPFMGAVKNSLNFFAGNKARGSEIEFDESGSNSPEFDDI